MAQGNVEVWLGKLCTMACRSVRSVIRNASVALQDPNFNLMEFLESSPAQVGWYMVVIATTITQQFARFGC